MALRICMLCFLSFFVSSSLWAGNGSSGVGTASIIHGFDAKNFEGSVENINDVIVDISNKEKIINVIKLQKNEIDFKQLSQSRFGNVNGYEYIPNSPSGNNYWVVCKTGEFYCYKLIPLSKSNKKIPSILGSLIETF